MAFIKIAIGLPQTNGGTQFQKFEGADLAGQPFLTSLHALGTGEVGFTYSLSPMPGGPRSWHGIGLETVILFASKVSPLKGDVLI